MRKRTINFCHKLIEMANKSPHVEDAWFDEDEKSFIINAHSNEAIMNFLRHLNRKNRPLLERHVSVNWWSDGINDQPLLTIDIATLPKAERRTFNQQIRARTEAEKEY